MSPAPLVTVILSTYNWSSVLPFSIPSVLNQTFSDFELLVVGDGCTDDSADVVAGFTDPRVRWINLPRNTGTQAGPNNEGLRQARGTLVAYIGHDDLWSNYHLENLVAYCKGREEAFAIAGIVWFDESRNVVYLTGLNGDMNIPEIRTMRHIPSGIMHSRSLTSKVGFWREYNDLPEMAPDREFFARLAKAIPCHTIGKVSVAKVPAGFRKDIYKRRDATPQQLIAAELNKSPSFVSDRAIDFLASKVEERSHYLVNTDVLSRRTRNVLGNLGLRYLRAQLEKRKHLHKENFFVTNRKFKGLE